MTDNQRGILYSRHPSTVEYERLTGELRQERADLARWKADYEALNARTNELADAATTALDALRSDQRCLALQTLADVLEGGAE